MASCSDISLLADGWWQHRQAWRLVSTSSNQSATRSTCTRCRLRTFCKVRRAKRSHTATEACTFVRHVYDRLLKGLRDMALVITTKNCVARNEIDLNMDRGLQTDFYSTIDGEIDAFYYQSTRHIHLRRAFGPRSRYTHDDNRLPLEPRQVGHHESTYTSLASRDGRESSEVKSQTREQTYVREYRYLHDCGVRDKRATIATIQYSQRALRQQERFTSKPCPLRRRVSCGGQMASNVLTFSTLLPLTLCGVCIAALRYTETERFDASTDFFKDVTARRVFALLLFGAALFNILQSLYETYLTGHGLVAQVEVPFRPPPSRNHTHTHTSSNLSPQARPTM